MVRRREVIAAITGGIAAWIAASPASPLDIRLKTSASTPPSSVSTGSTLSQSDEFNSSRAAQTIHSRVNQWRASTAAMSSLKWDSELAAVATDHARKIAETTEYSHKSPDGIPAETRVERGADCFSGENINKIRWDAIVMTKYSDEMSREIDSYMTLADHCVIQFARSEAHRNNMLQKQISAEGIGVAKTVDDTVYIVQDFC
jgi:uncharacterized protein YkwD